MAASKDIVIELDYFFSVYEAGDGLLLDADTKAIPFSGLVRVTFQLLEYIPAKDIRALEASKAQAAATWVESIVAVSSV